MTGRVGILGGTFNPVHVGHVSIAQQVAARLGLARVILVPAGSPPHKDAGGLEAAHHRYAMACIAARGMRGLAVSDVEVSRAGTSYTIETVEALRREFGPEIDLVLIIGMDSLLELPTWKEARRLAETTSFAVVSRPGYSGVDWEALGAALGPEAAKKLEASVVEIAEPVEVSATEVRRRLAEGRPVVNLVRAPVARDIEEKGLYRKRERDAEQAGPAAPSREEAR